VIDGAYALIEINWKYYREKKMNGCNGETCKLHLDTNEDCPFRTSDGCSYNPIPITEDTMRKIQTENYGEFEFTGEVIR
jgi:hypothetical protein